MSKRVQKVFTLPSRTKQSFKNECDINLIMKRFKKVMNTDYLEKFSGFVGGSFGDFSEVADYRAALDQVRAANEVFEALPSIVRRQFENDPALFLDFCHDPKNSDELVKMGLATPRVSDPVSEKIQNSPQVAQGEK